MPQIDENQASPTITVLLQRVMAAAIDVTLIAVPAMLVALAASERFPILEVANGRARFELADQLRINEIDSGLNRATQLGDTVYALSGAGLIVTIVTVMMMTLLVFVFMPALQSGQTPGRSILRLPTRSKQQGDAEAMAISIIDTTDSATDEADQKPGHESVPTASLGEMTRTSRAEERKRSSRATGRLVVKITDEVAEPIDEDAPVIETDSNPPYGKIGVAEDEEATPDEAAEVKAKVRSQTERPAGPDVNAGQLRALLQADLDRSGATAQVTLGDDEDYAAWADLDGLDLTDRSGSHGSNLNPFETLTLPESSLSETPLTATTAGGTTVTVEVPFQTEKDDPGAIVPEWSAELQAWIFHDGKSNRWFRHDQDQDRWIPIT